VVLPHCRGPRISTAGNCPASFLIRASALREIWCSRNRERVCFVWSAGGGGGRRRGPPAPPPPHPPPPALQKLATFCRIQETHPAKSCLKYGSSISIFRGRLFVFGGQRKSRSSLDNPTNCANVSRKVQRLSRQRLRRR
jgi:hypothetical protein